MHAYHFLDNLTAIVATTDNLDILLSQQNRCQAISQYAVIIGNINADSHRLTTTSIRQPWPGALITLSVPPSAWARSRIEASPQVGRRLSL